MASHSIDQVVIERLAIKPNKETGAPMAVVSISLAIDSAGLKYLGRRVGRVVSILFDDAQQEIGLEAAEA